MWYNRSRSLPWYYIHPITRSQIENQYEFYNSLSKKKYFDKSIKMVVTHKNELLIIDEKIVKQLESVNFGYKNPKELKTAMKGWKLNANHNFYDSHLIAKKPDNNIILIFYNWEITENLKKLTNNGKNRFSVYQPHPYKKNYSPTPYFATLLEALTHANQIINGEFPAFPEYKK